MQSGEERFGRYLLIRPVGEGGMAHVHLAQQIGPQGFVKPCVLKRISPGFVQQDRYRRMFLQEARVSALLNHPNIVQTFDFGEVDGTPYMAMEVVDGVNLAVLCRGLARMNRWIPLRAAVEICEQVCEALAYAHNLVGLDGRPLNLVHRDVSPQNILVSRQGTVKLADFGIARHDDRIEVTVGPTSKGKPGYMAPEQALGHSADPRTDLFAVGIVLTELISARRVTRSDDRPANIAEIENRVRELCAIRAESPKSLSELALRLTAIDMRARPASAKEAADALRAEAQKMSTKDALAPFLHRVFDRYFPPDQVPTALTGTGSAGSGSYGGIEPDSAAADTQPQPPAQASAPTDPVPPASSPSSPKPLQLTHQRGPADAPAAWAGILGGELPPPPVRSDLDLQVVSDVWDQVNMGETEQPAAAFGGWPSTFQPAAARPPASPLAAPIPTVKAPVPRPSAPVPVTDLDIGLEPIAAHSNPSPANGRDLIIHGSPSPPPPLAQPHAHAPAHGPAPARPLNPQSPSGLDLAAERLATLAEDQAPPDKPGFVDWLSNVLGDSSVLRWALRSIAAGILIAVAVIGWRLAGNRGVAPSVEAGHLAVSSMPAGARIFINDQDTGHVTPHEIDSLPIDLPMDVSVRLRGFISSPRKVPITITAANGRGQASFTLERARSYRIQSEPQGALVTMNGEAIPGGTPVELPPIRFGASATIALQLDGYLPAAIRLTGNAETATVTAIALERSRIVDIYTVPPEAKIFLDGKEVGMSPLPGVPVPSLSSFRIRVLRKCFKPFDKVFAGKNITEKRLEIELSEIAWSELPMSPEDRKRAMALERNLDRARRGLEQAEVQAKQAESYLDQLLARQNRTVQEIAQAHRNVDRARAKLDQIRPAYESAEDAMDEFRDGVLSDCGDMR